ncbi:MAG: hypothetical protein IKL40_01060 [Clostridia bacterium]|nr:hypothetical protein [Clostridia bacterium]
MDNKAKNIGNIAIRTVIVMALTVVISALSRFLFVKNMFEQEYFSEQMLNVWFLIFFLFIFNSLIIAINKCDKDSCINFLENVKNNKLISHIKFIVSSIDYYVEIICITVLSVVFPASFLYGFVNKIFFYGMDLSDLKNKLYTLLIVLPIMFVILFTAHITVQKSWYNDAKREKTKSKKGKDRQIVKSVITVVIVYGCSSIAIPWFLPLIVTFWNLGGIKLFGGAVLVLLVLALITIMLYYIRALLKRRTFIKKLKKYCFANSVYISDIKKPYLSLFVSQDGFDFTLEKNSTKYDCKFIAGIFPGSPIVLTDKGDGLKQDTVRLFRVELFSFSTKFDFGYESENKKILILLPIPRKFFVSVNEAPPHPADVGEKAGKYIVYNSTGFLNALERGTL